MPPRSRSCASTWAEQKPTKTRTRIPLRNRTDCTARRGARLRETDGSATTPVDLKCAAIAPRGTKNQRDRPSLRRNEASIFRSPGLGCEKYSIRCGAEVGSFGWFLFRALRMLRNQPKPWTRRRSRVASGRDFLDPRKSAKSAAKCLFLAADCADSRIFESANRAAERPSRFFTASEQVRYYQELLPRRKNRYRRFCEPFGKICKLYNPGRPAAELSRESSARVAGQRVG